MAVEKSHGLTPSEQYLARLSERTFLRLWSYPNVFRDQGRKGAKGDGKELCDLLVVCGDDVLIFSEKSCPMRNTDNVVVDWNRWYKRAIKHSAEQVYGAERWLLHYSQRVYIDCACKHQLPVQLPAPDKMRIHRIVVALGAKEYCRKHLRGSGSLVLVPGIKGDDHLISSTHNARPFCVGVVDPRKGFVHVFDDVTLDIAMKELNTITDFSDYLTHKEECLQSGKLELAVGEENMIAYYLSHMGSASTHALLACSPELDPSVMRVFTALEVGGEAQDEEDAT